MSGRLLDFIGSIEPGWRKSSLVIALGVLLVALVPGVTCAQSAIAGVVKDSSGGVLPGVTVEAASPALIEKVRTAVTDTEGRYNIVDLRPGVYSVTFTLTGFNTVRRSGVDLPSSFTATVNADLPVGALEESITVSGEAPVIDTQSTAQTKTLSTEILDAVPTGRLPQAYTVLIPGVSQPAENLAAGLPNSFVQQDLRFHGIGGSFFLLDGFDLSHRANGGSQYTVNQAVVQEVVVSTGSSGAEQQTGGVVTNVIPKEGGNTFSGQVYFHYTDDNFLGDNLTDELKKVGATSQSARKQFDFNPAVGGPLVQDKLWFFGSFRYDGSSTDSGMRYDVSPLDWVYTPDLTRPSASEQIIDRNYTLRLTLQATPRNKFNVFFDHQPKDWYNRSIGGVGTGVRTAPEASQWAPYRPNYVTQAIWRSPLNNRVLVEAGIAYANILLNYYENDHDALTGGALSPDLKATSALELTTNIRFRAQEQLGMLNHSRSVRPRGAVSYVTGTHAFKVGIDSSTFAWAVDRPRYRNGDMTVSLRTPPGNTVGVPVSVTLWGLENYTSRVKADLGVFAKDQWTRNRLTLNYGLRYDYFNTNNPAQDVPANRWLPARHFDAVQSLVTWHDISPRMAGSYDLFGTGRTAVKASLSKYMAVEGTVLTQVLAPSQASVTSVTRTWTDDGRNGGVAGDFVPQCNMVDPAANGECGVYQDLNFGKNNPRATTYDSEVLHGFGKRGYNWEVSTSVQHELFSGVALTGAYFRRWFGNCLPANSGSCAYAGDNTLVTSADFDPFCLTLPVDSRLPGGGGNQICGYYDVSPTKQGQRQTNNTYASNFGDQTRVYNGYEVTVNARLRNGAQVTGGTSTDRTTENNCFVVDSPQQLLFCDVRPPYMTSIKLIGFYPLPWGIQASGAFQSLPGPQFSTTDYVATNAEVAPSLGRNLAAGANATITVPIEQQGTRYGDRFNKLDARFSKIIRVGTKRFTGSLDIFNLFNGAGVVQVSSRYGPNYLNPTQILGARLFRFSGQVDF